MQVPRPRATSARRTRRGRCRATTTFSPRASARRLVPTMAITLAFPTTRSSGSARVLTLLSWSDALPCSAATCRVSSTSRKRMTRSGPASASPRATFACSPSARAVTFKCGRVREALISARILADAAHLFPPAVQPYIALALGVSQSGRSGTRARQMLTLLIFAAHEGGPSLHDHHARRVSGLGRRSVCSYTLRGPLPAPLLTALVPYSGYGIGFRQAGGDPAALMKLSVEHKVRFALRRRSQLPPV